MHSIISNLCRGWEAATEGIFILSFMIPIESVSELLTPPVAYHAALARMLKSPTAAIMLSQGMYWQRINKKQGKECFWITGDQWYEQTGLTVEHQKTARKILRDRGFWLENLIGVPAKLHYRIDVSELLNQLEVFLQTEDGDLQIQETALTSSGQWHKLDVANGTNSDVAMAQTIEKTNNKTNNKTTNKTNKENEKFSEPEKKEIEKRSLKKPNENNSHRADALKKIAISAKDAAKEVGYKTDSTLVDAFQMYLDYRKEMKLKPFASVKSAGIALKQLKRLSEDSRCTSLEIVEQTIASLWTGLFPLKRDKSQQNGKTHYQPIPEEYGPQPF